MSSDKKPCGFCGEEVPRRGPEFIAHMREHVKAGEAVEQEVKVSKTANPSGVYYCYRKPVAGQHANKRRRR